jgi:hypothetical protein
MEKEINIDAVLRAMREIIGNQAQEIAILKASIEASTTD